MMLTTVTLRNQRPTVQIPLLQHGSIAAEREFGIY